MRRAILLLLTATILSIVSLQVGCANNQSSTNTRIDEDIKALESTINSLVIDYYSGLSRQVNTNEIILCKIKPYKEGYLVLAWYTGEGSQVTLFNIEQDSNEKLVISRKVDMEPALSLGFSIKQIVDGDNTILCSNLNEETWIPPDDDKRIKADYSKIAVVLGDERVVDERVGGDKGYIIILSGKPQVVDMRLYNSKGKIVNSLKDLSNYGVGVVDIAFK